MEEIFVNRGNEEIYIRGDNLMSWPFCREILEKFENDFTEGKVKVKKLSDENFYKKDFAKNLQENENETL